MADSVTANSTPGYTSSVPRKLSSSTPFLSLKLYVIIAIIAALIFASVLLIFLCIKFKRRDKTRVKHSSGLIPLVSKEITGIENEVVGKETAREGKVGKQIKKEEGKIGNVEKEVIVLVKGESSGSGGSDEVGTGSDEVVVENIGWGRWYSLRELENATRGFAEENVIGEGGYGVVYRGVLEDGSVVAVKNLLNNK